MDEILPGNREKTNVSNGPSLRRTPSTREAIHHTTTIIVNKDERGYGMKVSGDNPVYVQSVKEGGAAERAGLHSGDKIIKVNGVNVTHSTHTEVVDLIKASTEVILTVQQRLSATMRASSIPSTPTNNQQQRTLLHHHSAPARDHITAPKPVDHEKQRQVECQRVHTLRLMLEKEQRYVEALRSELAKCCDSASEPKIIHELTGAERRVKTLQEQLVHLTGAKAESQPFCPPPPPIATLPTRQAMSMIESSSDSPPPLPQRNRPFTIATSPQSPPPAAVSTLPPQSPQSPQTPLSPPPLPPRQYLQNCSAALASVSDPDADMATNSNAQSVNASNVSATNPLVQTHHRTKSSPDQISNLLGNLSLAEASKRLTSSESISDLSLGTKRAKAGVVCDVDSPRITPPGTPPPPYPVPVTGTPESSSDPVSPLQQDDPDSSRGEPPPNDSGLLEASPVKTNHGAFVTQQPIISMEDDEMSDQEMNLLEDHGPFKSLSKLWEHNAHLAIFMNYVISNSDPSSLLFYLVTDLYKEGNAKEMKKWAYEIHSSFLVPGAPLRLNNVDENVAREIDEVLLNESDREEILRKIFWKARVKAKEELNEQLADFQQKRTAGLGTLFGPSDTQLDETIHDKNKEQKIIEQFLIPKMEPFIEDMEREVVDDRRFTMAAALGTIMGKVFGIRGQHFSSLLDRCPTFVSKEKSLKARLIGRSRKVTVRGHNLVAHQYYTVTYCNHCQLIIWGIGPQGYQCTNCNLNIHRPCVKTLDESCTGPLERKKDKGNDRISKLMEKIRPERETRRKPSSLIIAQLEKMKRQNDEKENDCVAGDNETGERPAVSGSKERRGLVDLVKEAEEKGNAAVNDDDNNHLDVAPHHATKSKSSATSINRSESYKERFHQKRQLRERRKTSDPNLSKTNSDVDVDHHGLTYHTNSGSSSNSSLSTRSLESPSNSLETVTGGGVKSDSVNNSTSAPQWDSDAEAEPDPPDWTKNVPEDVLRSLSPREKKRQEVINELFHTERSHVRGLKVLDQIFYQPMKETCVLPQDQIQLLFSNLEEMLVYHSGFNNCMKTKRRETPVIGDIGDLLLDMFDGAEGENFQKAAANFCSRQQIALEALKERRRKDPKLNSFLTDAEGNPMCRRLQLKDIIPTGMLRLTKYPLLFENLAKYTRTERSEEEMRMVLRALERSKEILNYVNQAVREAEDQYRLADIQRKLDKTSFDKADHPMVAEFKSLDLTKHRLIHEGVLNWRIGNRQKVIELHVVLLEDMIILLQRQDEKFVLKFHNTSSGGYLSPVIKVSHVLVRHNAVDKKALYLVNTSHNNAQIYDLVATSSSERKTWFKHISDAAIAYQNRDGKNRRPELSAAPLQDLDTASQDKTKESDSAVSSNNNNDLLSVPSTGVSSVSNNNESESSPTSPSNEVDSHQPDNASRKLGSSVADPLRLTEEQNELIQPNQVIISQRSVQTAEPILTPLEKLRRQDDMIKQALAEKQKLVADILHVPHDQFETFAEMASEPAMDKEAAELILAAVNQANQLSAAVSAALSVTEEDAVAAHTKSVKLPSVSTSQLQLISSSLNNHLSQLLNLMTERDEERDKLRREVQRSREQLHAMHELRQKFQNSQGDDSLADSTLNSQLLDSSALNESQADIDTSSGVEENPDASASVKLSQGNKSKSVENLDDTT